jgi:hypothetical protein
VANVAFPVGLFKPRPGLITFGEHGAAIDIPLSPFDLPGHGRIETSLRLDSVTLPSPDPAALAGQTLRFPINPDPGYIDGSIYIGAAHHPVDVSQIVLAAITGDCVCIQFTARIAFTFEGLSANGVDEYADSNWQFEAPVTFPQHMNRSRQER